LEGIMGHRAMRLRFLDMEPEEVFERAGSGDSRCVAFAEMWHRALAAATATAIHLEGPGKFFVSGPNARFVQVELFQTCLEEMVKMSPLQGSAVEVVSTTDELAVRRLQRSKRRPQAASPSTLVALLLRRLIRELLLDSFELRLRQGCRDEPSRSP